MNLNNWKHAYMVILWYSSRFQGRREFVLCTGCSTVGSITQMAVVRHSPSRCCDFLHCSCMGSHLGCRRPADDKLCSIRWRNLRLRNHNRVWFLLHACFRRLPFALLFCRIDLWPCTGTHTVTAEAFGHLKKKKKKNTLAGCLPFVVFSCKSWWKAVSVIQHLKNVQLFI